MVAQAEVVIHLLFGMLLVVKRAKVLLWVLANVVQTWGSEVCEVELQSLAQPVFCWQRLGVSVSCLQL